MYMYLLIRVQSLHWATCKEHNLNTLLGMPYVPLNSGTDDGQHLLKAKATAEADLSAFKQQAKWLGAFHKWVLYKGYTLNPKTCVAYSLVYDGGERRP